jgi:hypothetical protein
LSKFCIGLGHIAAARARDQIALLREPLVDEPDVTEIGRFRDVRTAGGDVVGFFSSRKIPGPNSGLKSAILARPVAEFLGVRAQPDLELSQARRTRPPGTAVSEGDRTVTTGERAIDPTPNRPYQPLTALPGGG